MAGVKGLGDKRMEELRKRASRSTSPPQRESPSHDTPKPTTESTPTPRDTSPRTPRPTSGPEPAPREHMVRTQLFLRPDQIAWLDGLAKERGVTRSDWMRYAVDELRRTMEGDAYTTDAD